MDLHAILRQARTVAIVGCSDNRFRASNHAAISLVDAACTVIPVNPRYQTVNGIPCYADFDDIPDEISIDLVNIFRNPSQTRSAVASVVRRAARTGQKPIVWTQPGVSTEDAETAAAVAGLPYVRDRCIMTELDRMPRSD